MPATGWEFKQVLDGSGSVRHNSTRLPAAALKGAVSPQTTAAVTPSAVDTVRTQFLSEHDTNRAGCYSSCFLSPTRQLFLKHKSPGEERGWCFLARGGFGLGIWKLGGCEGQSGVVWMETEEWSREIQDQRLGFGSWLHLEWPQVICVVCWFSSRF